MANMSLGAYTFAQNPQEADGIIMKRRIVAAVETYSGVHTYSWGTFIEGQTITLKWPLMPTAMFAELRTLYEADASVVFDPQDGEGKTFNVQIMALSGTYFVYLENAAGNFRQDVSLKLLITSEVV